MSSDSGGGLPKEIKEVSAFQVDENDVAIDAQTKKHFDPQTTESNPNNAEDQLKDKASS